MTNRRKTTAMTRELLKTDLYFCFGAGFEEKVRAFLRTSDSTRRAFALIPEPDSRLLVLLLCNVVFYRSQQIKVADLVERRTGTSVDNLENLPEEIRRFCAKIRRHVENSRELTFNIASYNTSAFERATETFLWIADSIESSRKMASIDAEHWRTGYPNAVRTLAKFMKQKTGKARFPSLEK